MSRTREQCLADFSQAVGAYRLGITDDAAVILRRLRAQSGQVVADQAKREIINFAKSGKKLP